MDLSVLKEQARHRGKASWGLFRRTENQGAAGKA